MEPIPGEQKPELTRLDGILNELGQPNEVQCELLRAHLESARAYLLGAMPVEYRLSLQMAGASVNAVADDDLCERICEFLQSRPHVR